MNYAVLVRIDSTGRRPVIAGPGTNLRGSDGARWQYVAETDDLSEAERIHALVLERLDRGEY